jgi:hypothetical protein
MGEVNLENRGAAASALAGTYFHVSNEVSDLRAIWGRYPRREPRLQMVVAHKTGLALKSQSGLHIHLRCDVAKVSTV